MINMMEHLCNSIIETYDKNLDGHDMNVSSRKQGSVYLFFENGFLVILRYLKYTTKLKVGKKFDVRFGRNGNIQKFHRCLLQIISQSVETKKEQ